MVTSDRKAMRLAIRVAQSGVEKGQSPFGCCIVKDGRVLACAHNTVWLDTDPTRHAEVNAISQACRELGSIDLTGCELFATCEPCPMCFSAAHWARVSKIVYGARIADAARAGFNELSIPAEKMKRDSSGEVELVSGFMAEECRELFQVWAELKKGRPY